MLTVCCLTNTTDTVAFNFAYDSGQSAPNMDAATIASDFGVRIVEPIPSTAADVGAVAVSQGVAHAGEFVVVGSDGNITTVTMTAWQGGSY